MDNRRGSCCKNRIRIDSDGLRSLLIFPALFSIVVLVFIFLIALGIATDISCKKYGWPSENNLISRFLHEKIVGPIPRCNA